ncbi:MAG: hypothetical protein M5U28_11325 [Sandaracinaceae bacterium]|nr:hypothetical protein [Sandaracinaceae bacterium]
MAALLLASCEDGDPVACTTSALEAGLIPLAHAYVAPDEARIGHSRELVVDGELLFVADSNGLPILEWREGELELLHGIEWSRTHHCSTLALHAPSRTLVCAAADSRILTLEDVRDPERPRSRYVPEAQLPSSLMSVRDLAIAGDTVWLATDVGLSRATISAEGDLGPVETTGVGGDVVQVELAGDRVVILDRGEGLVVVDARTLERRGGAILDGPPIDLALDGDRVVVSLGSEGAAIFAIDPGGQASPIATVQPRCVATASDLEGAQLAVACLSGLTLYDLSGGEPRPAGFVPSRYGLLDVAFTSFGLVVVDWFRVDVLAANPGGEVIVADVPRAMRLAAGAGARVPLRNPGAEPLAIEWLLRRERGGGVRSGSLTLPASGEAVVELSRAELEAAGSLENKAELAVFPAGAGSSCDGPRTRLWHRGPGEDPAHGQPGVGDPFPTLSRTVDGAEPAVLPVAGTESLLMFVTLDCFLQWPQLEDMAWRLEHGSAGPAPVVLYLTISDPGPGDLPPPMGTFGAEALLAVPWASYHRSVPGNETETNPVAAFERSFLLRTPGADFPHDYHLDASGRVVATSRLYRGRWPLGE